MNLRKCCTGTITFDAIEEHSTSVTSECRFQKSFISNIRFTYPLKILVPDFASNTNCQWLYPVTFGGGLVEGDDINLNVTVNDNVAAAIVTQSSTKVFQCPSNNTTKQSLNLNVGKNALLASLPDPIVCYEGAIYHQDQVISLTETSNLIMLDWYTAGRTARGEVWHFNSYGSSTRINLNGETVYLDSIVLQNRPYLDIKTAMKHFQVSGAIVLLGDDLATYGDDLSKLFNKQKSYGSVYGCDNIVAVSPLNLKTKDSSLRGCMIKFSSQSTSQAYEVVKAVLDPMIHIIGGDPFENKY